MQNHIEFICSNIHIDQDDDNVRFAASDDDLDPKQYLIIDIITKPTSQDLQLGMVGYYIEISGQALGQYGGISNILLNNCDLIIAFDRASHLGKQINFIKLKFRECEKAYIDEFFKTHLNSLL